MPEPRHAGVIVPLFSLRDAADAGIGDFGSLLRFVDWSAGAGHEVVSLLPLAELGPGEQSPYSAISAFALEPLHVAPELLPELDGAALGAPPPGKRTVDRAAARAWKAPLLAEAFARFRALPDGAPRKRRFAAFREAQRAWLGDYALFRALLEESGWIWWRDWPAGVRDRDPGALAAASRRLADEIALHEFVQFAAFEQWRDVRDAARRRGVRLMGDLPFAPSENSADVWAHAEWFDPTRSVGAPPDAFSATGQRWGLPMFRWQDLRASDWRWLRDRARWMGELYDLFRIDHVVGLFRTFAFAGEEPLGFDPAEEPAQIAQGREILSVFTAEAGAAELVAEDLGLIPDFVRDVLRELGVPGYKVMRFEADDGRFRAPASYAACSIATTGTHDTTTLVAWWEEEAAEDERRALLEALGEAPAEPPVRLEPDLRRRILGALYDSPARFVVLPVQDVFGWRERVNLPGTVGAENWSWRLPATTEELGTDPALRRETEAVRRLIDASGRLRTMTGDGVETRSQMTDVRRGSVQANGIRFEYLEAGSGPLVLCLHGFPDHAPSFRDQLPALAAAGFRAVAPYMRGYAPTEAPPDGPYQSAMLAKDAVALLDALSPNEPAVVFGHDWGAVAAYGAAEIAPERVRKVIGAAVPAGPQLFQALLSSYEQMRRSWYVFMFQLPTAETAVEANDFEFLDRIWRDWSPGWTLPAADMEALKATFRKPGVLPAALAYYRHTFQPALQRPELAKLQETVMVSPIRVPAMHLHGEDDGCIGVEVVQGMEAVCPKGLRKVIVPGAGHFVHQEKPELVNREVLAFLEGDR